MSYRIPVHLSRPPIGAAALRGLLCAAVLCVLVLPPPAAATTVLPLRLADLVDGAELIFQGTATHVESFPAADGTEPYTLATFAVEDVLKGSTEQPEVTLRLAGGIVDDEIFEVEGLPHFEVGHGYLLFVHGNGDGPNPLLGWWQGELDLVRHPRSGQTVLVDSRGQEILGVEGGAWRRGPRLDAAGQAAGDGVQVVGEEGVTISGLEAAAPEPPAVPAAEVLAELRALVQARRGGPGFTPGRRFSPRPPERGLPAISRPVPPVGVKP